ncbi:MAG: hypothetical protein CL758_06725 [Chloroflexi bacterium]|nr:hypothetical protein [Chloroflexota bacterium]|tara:strand:- start:5967 stop:6260 length:294 start_codon:yes stop_codon:yes gene_type:complete
MPSKSRKAAIRQSNIRKRKKISKPNVKTFDLEKANNLNEPDQMVKENSEFSSPAPKPINKKESVAVFDNNLFFELRRVTLFTGLIAVLLGILTVAIP